MSAADKGGGACFDERAAVELAAGRLADEVAARARAHARSCRRCAALVEQVAGPTLPAVSPPRPGDASRTVSLVPSGVTSTEPALERAALSLAPGSLVGHFVVLRRLGAGAMGEVYAAYDPKLDRKVALKVLKPAVGDPAIAEQLRARMRREAQALARLSHPSLVGVYEVLTHGEEIIIVMEHVSGGNLREWLKERRSWREIVRAFRVAGEGLAAAHESGIVHRDFKPDNVLASEDGGFKVADFGVSRLDPSAAREEVPHATPLPDVGAAVLATAAGSLIGTPAYMSPEALSGQEATEATDVYAFSSALYEALCGELPFSGHGLGGLLDAKRAGRLRPLSGARSVPRWLHRIVARGIDPDPRRRYPSMRALLAELSRDRTRERRLWGTVAVGVPLALWVVGAAFRRPPDLCREAGKVVELHWNDRQRDRIRVALRSATGRGNAVAEDEVERTLGTWFERWRDEQVAACRETPFAFSEVPGPTTSARRVCLEKVLGEALSWIDVLEGADAAVATQAPHLARALPDSSACAGMSMSWTQVSQPLRQRQVRARLKLGALAAMAFPDGTGDAAMAELERAHGEAVEGGWHDVAAEALLLRATLEEARGERESARLSGRRALLSALRGRAPERLPYVWAVLAKLSFGDPEVAAQALEVAVAVNEGLGESPRTAYALACARLRQAATTGRQVEAVAHAREAEQAARRLFGDGDPEVARARGELGAALLAAGDPAEAAASLRQALTLRGRGASHFEAGRWGALLARALAVGTAPGALGPTAVEAMALARADLTLAGPPAADELRALDAWLANLEPGR